MTETKEPFVTDGMLRVILAQKIYKTEALKSVRDFYEDRLMTQLKEKDGRISKLESIINMVTNTERFKIEFPLLNNAITDFLSQQS